MSKIFKSRENFKYLQHATGINKDGEKYVSVTVLDDEKNKYSFVSHDDKVISQFTGFQIADYSDITLFIGFTKVFNPNTRYSNWQSILLGVE